MSIMTFILGFLLGIAAASAFFLLRRDDESPSSDEDYSDFLNF